MAKFGTHGIFGLIIAFGYIMTKILTDQSWPASMLDILLAVALVTFAEIPDIDQANSYARKMFLGASLTSIILLALLDMTTMVIIVAIGTLIALLGTKHRGWMHSSRFGLLITVPFIWYDWVYAVFAFASFSSHLALDRFTKKNKFPY